MALKHSLALVLTLATWCSLAAAKEPPLVELAISDEALTAALAAACPIRQTVDSGAAGFPGAAKLDLELSEPSVHVTNAAVKVTLRYHARDTGGLIDLTGVAKPDLRFVVLPAKGVIEARLSRLLISIANGVEIPLELSLAPFSLPAVWSSPVDMNGKPMIAEITVREIVPETGRAVLRGEVAFKPAKSNSSR